MITKEDYKQAYDALKKDYDKAIAEGKLIFDHQGQPCLVAYAKYRLEYFQLQINSEPKKKK
jgi:hypothetical protein